MIFYGPQKEFEKNIPDERRNLTDLVMEIDNDSKNMSVFVDKDIPPPTKIIVKNFVIESSEYAGVKEHVIQNFINFISNMNIENMYLHNPPLQISAQVERIYSNVEIINYKYKSINKKHIVKIYNQYEDVIKGQASVKKSLLRAIFPLLNKKRKLPVVILFYGDTGLGKTETAKFLSNIVGENLFRKQFSMYQNNQFATYLFGGNHSEPSFAKDLLNRESNIILLDEFDKANATFHSAFYQLFDDGIFKDQNYSLELYKSIIICTSNYKSEKEIKKDLGNAIFARFDAVIRLMN